MSSTVRKAVRNSDDDRTHDTATRNANDIRYDNGSNRRQVPQPNRCGPDLFRYALEKVDHAGVTGSVGVKVPAADTGSSPSQPRRTFSRVTRRVSSCMRTPAKLERA